MSRFRFLSVFPPVAWHYSYLNGQSFFLAKSTWLKKLALAHLSHRGRLQSCSCTKLIFKVPQQSSWDELFGVIGVIIELVLENINHMEVSIRWEQASSTTLVSSCFKYSFIWLLLLCEGRITVLEVSGFSPASSLPLVVPLINYNGQKNKLNLVRYRQTNNMHAHAQPWLDAFFQKKFRR